MGDPWDMRKINYVSCCLLTLKICLDMHSPLTHHKTCWSTNYSTLNSHAGACPRTSLICSHACQYKQSQLCKLSQCVLWWGMHKPNAASRTKYKVYNAQHGPLCLVHLPSMWARGGLSQHWPPVTLRPPTNNFAIAVWRCQLIFTALLQSFLVGFIDIHRLWISLGFIKTSTLTC